MQSTPQRDPDWEHWPGRPTGDEGVRSRLRALFVPTDAEDAITELITEHSRELETRAAELRAAVAELEQRELRARELHARVEQVLPEPVGALAPRGWRQATMPTVERPLSAPMEASALQGRRQAMMPSSRSRAR